MKKNILGLDLGTNSIGWALLEQDFQSNTGKIKELGVRIIPMSQDILGKFESGQSVSQTAERTQYRSVRKLYQRANLRRERLHRVLNILGFLPAHYQAYIDFENKKGQFHKEVKLNYKKNAQNKYDFIFKTAFLEMASDFKQQGIKNNIPYDWTIYYLRKKALHEAIHKEELAWIILNFNQKRGYFQLRDMTETEEKEGVEKTFEVLKIEKVIENGEIIKKNGTKLYDVYFENGWKYDKPIAKPEDWINKAKEFIVTTKKLKDGQVKRTFKKVDSEKDWIAIKKKIENDIKKSGKFVGPYIYDHLLKNPKQKIKGKLIKTIERDFYQKELEAILQKQKAFHPELSDQNLLIQCLHELYPHNEGHRNQLIHKDINNLLLHDIIFYQRPLKSQKHLISGCPFEKIEYQKQVIDDKTGNKKTVTITKEIPVIHKSHPLYESFRLWQFLHNLKIYQKEKTVMDKTYFDLDVTRQMLPDEADWVKLYDFLSTKKEMSQKTILEFLIKQRKIDKIEKENFRWNYPEDKKYPAKPVRAGFLNRLKKVEHLKLDEFFTDEIALQLWHLIYSIKDKETYKKALKTFASRHHIDSESFVKNFEKYPAFNAEYGGYSYKALKKIVPLMQMGKYWNENLILPETKTRIQEIIDRLESIHFDASKLEQIADDDINLPLLKSFLPFKDQNPLKGLNTYQATYAIYGRHSEFGNVQYWHKPEDIDRYLNDFKQHSLRNPIVEQVILETLRTVRDIWKELGQSQAHFFDEIHLELGRELKNPADARKAISKNMAEKERTNKRIKALLKEMTAYGANPQSPSHAEILKIYDQDVVNSRPDLPQDIKIIHQSNDPSPKQIERYKLWLEQKYVSPYTGQPIPLSKLFTTEYQIEHIIPQSRYFDNSINNKVIAESDVNLDKSNQTAYAYIKQKGGSIIDGHKLLTLKEYEAHCKSYFNKNKRKLQNLLSEDIPDEFINRQLNDTRYISKMVKALLSHIVRESDEQAETSKHLLPVVGFITSKLKHDWGLQDKWNQLILPRFKRLNDLTNTKDFTYSNQNGIEVPKIPDYISGKINKKRIDHRHHALDALVIAAVTRNHINYINALNNEKIKHNLQPQLLVQNADGRYRKSFKMPWPDFPLEAFKALKTLTPSFKQNLRVINKATNHYWKWVQQKDGRYKKQKIKQTKGAHWAIRKPLHKETVYGKWDGVKTPKNKIATFVKTDLGSISKEKHIHQIIDHNIREVIIPNHLKNYTDDKGQVNYEAAFSPEGIESLNKNITTLNRGKAHQPIFKVKMYEVGSRFPLSDNINSAKHKKYAEAAKGTNLYFAIYWDANKQKRNYETIPLREVIEHQKQVAHLPKTDRTPIPIRPELGQYLFSLSPNDLVYVPMPGEDLNTIDFDHLTTTQKERIYKMVSSTGSECHFLPSHIASVIYKKIEFGSLNKNERALDGLMIKETAIKLKVDRLGHLKAVKTIKS